MIDLALDDLTKLILPLDKNQENEERTQHDKENSRDLRYNTGFGPIYKIEEEQRVK